MPSGMYSTIHLLEIMRRSAFKSLYPIHPLSSMKYWTNVHTLTNIHNFRPNTPCSLAWLVAGRNTLGGGNLWSQTDCGTVQTVLLGTV
jgi:hypothetical protein